MDDEPTAVSKEAREYAANLMRDTLGGVSPGDAAWSEVVRKGEDDAYPFVQAFASFEAHIRTPAMMLMTQEWLDAKVATDPDAEVEARTPASGEAGEMAISVGPFLEWMEQCWPEGTGSDFNQGVVRGFEIIKAQIENGHVPLTRLSTDTEAMRLLREAREALTNYACHAGPDAPCLRSADQCANECGKAAGDAIVSIDALAGKGGV